MYTHSTLNLLSMENCGISPRTSILCCVFHSQTASLMPKIIPIPIPMLCTTNDVFCTWTMYCSQVRMREYSCESIRTTLRKLLSHKKKHWYGRAPYKLAEGGGGIGTLLSVPHLGNHEKVLIIICLQWFNSFKFAKILESHRPWKLKSWRHTILLTATCHNERVIASDYNHIS